MIPRGAGTGFTGGTLPVEGGVVLVLTKMNKILQIDPENLLAVVEPGVVTYDLQQEVEKIGLFYPPDPASLKTSTLGGNVAECAGGPRAVKYGVTKDYVLGLEVGPADWRDHLHRRPDRQERGGLRPDQAPGGLRRDSGDYYQDHPPPAPAAEGETNHAGHLSRLSKRRPTRSPRSSAPGSSPPPWSSWTTPPSAALRIICTWGLPVEAGALLIIEVDGAPEALARGGRRDSKDLSGQPGHRNESGQGRAEKRRICGRPDGRSRRRS